MSEKFTIGLLKERAEGKRKRAAELRRAISDYQLRLARSIAELEHCELAAADAEQAILDIEAAARRRAIYGREVLQ